MDVAALSPVPTDLRRRALSAGLGAGLVAVGVTSADPFEGTRHDLESRKAAGLHATMQFTYRNPARSTDPRASLPWARAMVAGAWGYGADAATAAVSDPTRPAGRVALYAAHDHYAGLRGALEVVASVLRDDGWRAVVLVDGNQQVDRAVAHRAGLGWYGKNSLLLLPRAGSWFLLGSVATDAPLDATTAGPVPDGCGWCTRCIEGCPTGAIVAPGVVDARRCLAWIVQAAGSIPRELRVSMGDRIYGCDDCQEVCPPNRVQLRRRSTEGVEPVRPEAELRHPRSGVATGEWVDLLGLLSADDSALLERHGRWYIAGRDPRWLRRNALVALGNTADPGDDRVGPTLREVIDGDDDLLAAHAIWAARRLGRHDLLDPGPSRPGPHTEEELRAPHPPPRPDLARAEVR